jgi:beta-xylosidase
VPADLRGLSAALENPSWTGGGFRFSVSDQPGTNFAVEASADLVNWVRVATNTAPFTFVDIRSSQFEKQFYRAVVLPEVTSPDPVVAEVVLGNPVFAGGSLVFTVSVPAGVSVAMEVSEDLRHWIPVQTNTAPFTFVADASQLTQRFYRAAILP